MISTDIPPGGAKQINVGERHPPQLPRFSISNAGLTSPLTMIVSLPVLNDGNLPLGLQVLGFAQNNSALFGVVGWIENALRG